MSPRSTDHEFGLERQPLEQCGTQRGLADAPTDDKRSCRAHVQDIEIRQLFSEKARLKRFVPSDIHAPQEYDESHNSSTRENGSVRFLIIASHNAVVAL